MKQRHRALGGGERLFLAAEIAQYLREVGEDFGFDRRLLGEIFRQPGERRLQQLLHRRRDAARRRTGSGSVEDRQQKPLHPGRCARLRRARARFRAARGPPRRAPRETLHQRQSESGRERQHDGETGRDHDPVAARETADPIAEGIGARGPDDARDSARGRRPRPRRRGSAAPGRRAGRAPAPDRDRPRARAHAAWPRPLRRRCGWRAERSRCRPPRLGPRRSPPGAGRAGARSAARRAPRREHRRRSPWSPARRGSPAPARRRLGSAAGPSCARRQALRPGRRGASRCRSRASAPGRRR